MRPTRTTVDLLLALALAIGSTTRACGSVADYWPDDSWPQWRRDPAKNAFNPVSTSPASLPVTCWRFATPANAANSSPAVVNGKVVFGTSDGTVYCLRQITANPGGELIWSYPTGDRIWNSPAVAYNRVFITSRDGYLYCLKENPTNPPAGQLIWKAYIGPGGIMVSSPCVVNGRVYVGSDTRYLYAFDALTDDPEGALLWKYYCAGVIHGSPAVAAGRVYAGTGGGSLPTNGYRLFCLQAETTNSAGELLWSFRLGDKANGSMITPAVADGHVYLSADDGWMRCLNATNGAVVWQRFIKEMDGPSPAVACGRVFKSYEHGGLDCWLATPANDPESDGELIWSLDTSEVDRTGVTVADGKVLQVTWYDRLHCYDARANQVTELWTFSPIDQPQQFGSAPSIANGLIFVGDGNGLRALRPTTGNLPPGVSARIAAISGPRASFLASAYDLDGTIASYFWQFGDGTSSATQNPTHEYAEGGEYIARVRVTDHQGASNEATLFLTVTPNPAWHLSCRLETNGVSLTWEGGIEPRQFLERCRELAGTNALWQTIWTNEAPVPPAASYGEVLGSNRQAFYRLRAE